MNLSPDKQREMLRQMLTIRTLRGAGLGRLSRRQDLRRRALLHRRGGRCRRRLRRARAGRPDHLDASRPRPLHRQGRRPQAHDGRALWPADRLLQGQGRLHAHRRFRHRHARRERHRRRRHLDRHRRGARGADGRQRPRRRLLLRRRRLQCRARSTSASTSRRPGSCRSSTSARTTCTRRRPRLRRRTPCRMWPAAPPGYGIPGVIVDGNDIFAVYQAAARAVARARAGEGPTLIECKTYRWRAAHRARRPAGLPHRRRRSRSGSGRTRSPGCSGSSSPSRASSPTPTGRRWTARCRATIECAVAFAEASPFPTPEQAVEDVYAA